MTAKVLRLRLFEELPKVAALQDQGSGQVDLGAPRGCDLRHGDCESASDC